MGHGLRQSFPWALSATSRARILFYKWSSVWWNGKEGLVSFRRCFWGEGMRGFKVSPLCQCSAAESLMLEGWLPQLLLQVPHVTEQILFRVLCFTVMPWNESCSKWLRKHQWCLRNSGPSLSMVREGRSKLSIDAVSPFSSSCLKKKDIFFSLNI